MLKPASDLTIWNNYLLKEKLFLGVKEFNYFTLKIGCALEKVNERLPRLGGIILTNFMLRRGNLEAEPRPNVRWYELKRNSAKGFNVNLTSRNAVYKLTQLLCFRAMGATLNEFRGSLITQIFLTLFPVITLPKCIMP